MEKLDIAHQESIKALLAENSLTFHDLDFDTQTFFGHILKDKLVAIGAVEGFGEARLLRSLAVANGAKGKGLGKKLLKEIEGWSQEQQVKTLYLLTEDAKYFFARQGYQLQNRTSVPKSISNTKQFKLLCPESAECMFKNL